MKSILYILLFFSVNTVVGQQIIAGKVISNKNETVYGARVTIAGTYDGAITDPNGHFRLKTNLKDSIQLSIKAVGYESIVLPLYLAGDSIWQDVILRAEFKEFEAVVITAGSFEAGDKKNAVLVSALDLMTIPGASGNVISALQFLPGTTVNGESEKLFVRGGTSQESNSFIDGALVHNPYNASAPNTSVRSRFNPFMFEGPVFSTGGFSAEFGESLSSVLLLETKGLQEQDQVDISIMSVGLGLAGTKKWEKSAITASVDYSNLAPYMTLVPQDMNWKKMPETIETALNFRKKTEKGLIKIYGNYSHSNFSLYQSNLDTKQEDLVNLKNKNMYLNSSYKGRLGKKRILNLSTSFTDYTEATDFNQNQLVKQTYGGHAKARVKHIITNRIQLNSGVELFAKQYAETYKSQLGNRKEQFSNCVFAGFSEAQIYFNEKFVARIGGRLDYSELMDEVRFSPRISTAYKLNKTSQIALAGGWFYQSPNDEYLLYSNQIDFENTQQIMLNYSATKNSRSFKAEVYYKEYKDLIKFDKDQPFYSPSHYSNKGSGYAYGLDVFFRDKKTIKNGEYWVSYSYLDTKRDYLNFPQSSTPSFSSKHNLSIVYKHWVASWRTLLGASFSMASPRMYNDPNDAEFNGRQMKAYQSLNLNISFLFKQNVIFYLSATNVLGYQQEYGYRFSNTPNSDGKYDKQLITPPADRFFILGCFITLSKSGKENQLDKIQ
jgi:hypothetical protein